jgi:hypothetical protein
MERHQSPPEEVKVDLAALSERWWAVAGSALPEGWRWPSTRPAPRPESIRSPVQEHGSHVLRALCTGWAPSLPSTTGYVIMHGRNGQLATQASALEVTNHRSAKTPL